MQLLGFLLFATAVGSAAAEAVTPMEKVITLLTDLKQESEDEGKAESITYDKFACFCKSESDTRSDSIKSGDNSITELSATIGQKTAEKADKASEVARRKAKLEELAKELEATIAECNKEKTRYEVNDADLQKALNSMNSAIAAMEGSKPSAAAALLLQKSVGQSLRLAQALNLIATPKQKAVTAFLQVNPEDPEYKYHSQGIVDILNKLLEDFRAEKKDADEEWAKTEKGCIDTQAALNSEIDENKRAIEQLVMDIEKLKQEIAEARGNLIEAQQVLSDDQLFLKDLTERCEVRAQDWDQRTQMRGKEVNALEQALEILTNEVKGMSDEVNKRAMFIQRQPSNPAPKKENAVVQATAEPHKDKKAEAGKSFLQRSQGLSKQIRQEKALSALVKASKRLGSPILAQLAAKAAADPFLKVKDLIQKLVERLIHEATQEATKKGFCDTELAKAEKDREFRYNEVKKLNVELEALEVKRDALDLEMDELREAIDGQTETLKVITEDRSTEKGENEDSLEKAKRGLKALNEAILILKSFYKQAAKALLVQVSPIDEGEALTPGFEGAYKGKQSGSKAIIGLLEVIKSDFERTVRTTEASEKKSQAEFVLADRDLRSDTGGKETKEELDKQDHKTTLSTIESKFADLQTNMDLVDKANAELEELKPVCIDTGMSYTERVEKREEEIAALNNALCLLDTDNVEDDCKNQAA